LLNLALKLNSLLFPNMKTALLCLASSSFLLASAAKAWDVNNWMDRAQASTCSQLIQTATYYQAQYYSTGNKALKDKGDATFAKAKAKGCK
jgi:hypothetical protein